MSDACMSALTFWPDSVSAFSCVCSFCCMAAAFLALLVRVRVTEVKPHSGTRVHHHYSLFGPVGESEGYEGVARVRVMGVVGVMVMSE